MMTSGDLSSMYAQIVNGKVSKEDSRFVTDEESGALWDKISSEVTAMRTADPNIVFSIPNEMPDADDDEAEDAPSDAETPTDDADTAEEEPEPDPAAEGEEAKPDNEGEQA